MRDLKRPNSLTPAYKQLAEMGIEIFTPMRWRVVSRRGVTSRDKVPFLQDLLFVHSTSDDIDNLLCGIPTLQYRFVRGSYRKPIIVGDNEMNRFIKAVKSVDAPQYYSSEEITPDMIGRQVCIVGGQLNGYEGKLLKCRGTRKRRLLVAIPNLIVAAIEVEPEFVKLV